MKHPALKTLLATVSLAALLSQPAAVSAAEFATLLHAATAAASIGDTDELYVLVGGDPTNPANVQKVVGAKFLRPGATAGGSLTGTYPNPTIAAGAVSGAMLASGAAATNLGAPGGDLSGAWPNPTVARIQGRAFPSGATTNGQIPIGSTTDGNWHLGTITAGANVTVTNSPGGITIASSGGGGGSLTVTDGTTPVVASTETLGNGFKVTDLGSGNAKVDFTAVVSDHTASNYPVVATDVQTTMLVGNGHTYTIPPSTTTGFGNQASFCLLNTTGSNATLTAAPSLFNGAGGATSLTLRPKAMACPTGDGTNYNTVLISTDGGDLTAGSVAAAALATGAAASNLGAAGSDLSGTYPNPTVVQIQGKAWPSSAVATGEIPIGNAGVWNKARLTAGSNVTIDDTTTPGHITISAAAGSGTPGGSNGAIQYNNSGAFGGAVITGLVKGVGTSPPTAATAGTDYGPGFSRRVYGTPDAANTIAQGDYYVSLGATDWTVPATYTFSNSGLIDGQWWEIADDGNHLNGQAMTLAAGAGYTISGVTQMSGSGQRIWCRDNETTKNIACWGSISAGGTAQILLGQGLGSPGNWVALGNAGTLDSLGNLTITKVQNTTYPASILTNQIPFASFTNTISNMSAVNGAVINTNSSGVPAETITPVLGVQGTSNGTLGLAASGASATTTLSAADTTTSFTFKFPGSQGLSGQVFTSQGPGVAPIFTTLAGGGNVSNSGTPTANQVATWVDSTHIQGVAQLGKSAGGTGSSTGIGAATNLSQIYKSGEDNAQHTTSSTTEVKAASCPIPQSGPGATGAIRFNFLGSKTGTNGAWAVKIYYSSTNDLAGQLLTSFSPSNTVLSQRVYDVIHFRSAAVQRTFPSDGLTTSSAAPVATTVDSSAGITYVVASLSVVNASDVAASEGLSCEVLPPGGN